MGCAVDDNATHDILNTKLFPEAYYGLFSLSIKHCIGVIAYDTSQFAKHMKCKKITTKKTNKTKTDQIKQ